MNKPTTPPHAQALELLAEGNISQARELLRSHLKQHPEDGAVWNSYGLAFAKEGNWTKAAQSYQQALRCDRRLAGVHNNMGTALRHLGDLAQAEKAHRRALELNPMLMEAHNNLGLLWMETDRPQEAAAAFRRALELDGSNVAVRENLAKALYLQGDRQAATAAWESVLALANPELAWNMALAELAAGHWERGWRLYESRFHRPKGRVPRRHTQLPPWDKRQSQAHLLLWGEQGAGDQIMATRWLAPLRNRVAKLTVECDHRLLTLFANSFPDIQFIPARQRTKAAEIATATHQCPMLDLPALLGLAEGKAYAQLTRLQPPEALQDTWKQRLGAARAPRIALVWAGNPTHVNDKQRSLPLALMRRLVHGLPGAEFHSLQVGDNAMDLTGSNLPIQDWSARIGSYADSAALLKLMDAVVTVDTSVVHLAGSMGCPTWLLLPAVPEWRWDTPESREDTCLWYDSVHYVRQQQAGDWPSAIDTALAQLASRFPRAAKATGAGRRWQQTVRTLITAGKAAQLPGLRQFAADQKVARLWLQSLLHEKKNAEALVVLEALLRHAPDDVPLLLLASDMGRRLAQGEVAVRHARHAVSLDKDNPEAHLHLGNALRTAGDLDAAALALEQALALNPEHMAALGNLGVVKRELGDIEAAITLYRQVIAKTPDYLPVRSNLGNALREQGKFAESEACFRFVIEHDGNNPEAYYGLGNTLKENVQIREAISAYRQGLAVAPSHSDLKVNLSLQLLLDGQLAEGWDLYEERFFRPDRPVPQRKFPQPWWRGEALAGKTLLLWGEQGAGDRLMFARLLPQVVAQAEKVIVETDPRMLTLMARSFPQVTWIPERNPPDKLTRTADWQAPIGHLAKVHLRALDQFDAGAAYLQPDPELLASWKSRLAHLQGTRIGLVWAGNPGHQNDKNRSLSLDALAPLLDLPGISFVSLQVGDQAGEFGTFAARFFDAAPMIKSYDDTAALLANLDAVVAVDTSVAHLAGAVGCPCHVLLPYCPDWRWLVAFPDSTPWYRSLRLYRQTSWQNWHKPIARLVADLAATRVRSGMPTHAIEEAAQEA